MMILLGKSVMTNFHDSCVNDAYQMVREKKSSRKKSLGAIKLKIPVHQNNFNVLCDVLSLTNVDWYDVILKHFLILCR